MQYHPHKCKYLAAKYATFCEISAGEPNLKLAGSKEQERTPLLRSAARTRRRAGDTETASIHSRSCSTAAGDLCRISASPLLFLSLSLTLSEVRAFAFARWNSHEFTEELRSPCKSERNWTAACSFFYLPPEKASKWAVWIWEQEWAEQRRLDGAKYWFAFMAAVMATEALMRSLDFFCFCFCFFLLFCLGAAKGFEWSSSRCSWSCILDKDWGLTSHHPGASRSWKELHGFSCLREWMSSPDLINKIGKDATRWRKCEDVA